MCSTVGGRAAGPRLACPRASLVRCARGGSCSAVAGCCSPSRWWGWWPARSGSANWQFDRLTERKADNAVVRANEDKDPAPVADVLAVDRRRRATPTSGGWSRRPARTPRTDTVVVRYRSRDGVSGIDVVVPLVTADGTALLVDRGWLEAEPDGTDRSGIPDPPAGEVDGDRLGARRRDGRQHRWSPTSRPGRSPAGRSARRWTARSTAASSSCRPRTASRPPGSSPSSCRSSTTARTSSTACSGGSSACWPSSASATSPGTSAGTGRAASGRAARRPRGRVRAPGASRRRPAASPR